MIKKSISTRVIVITCFLISFAAMGQTRKWESVFYADAQFQYLTNLDTEPNSNWREIGFNDSGWHQGIGGIGYGDGDDGTIVQSATAVFLRKEFTIADEAEINEAALSVDYDDAFVAYLNGVEVARSAGLADAFPALSSFSSAQHEAKIPTGGSPESFIIDALTLSNLLKTGTNVLAIQVHNAGATSSDLSSSTWLHVGLRQNISRYQVVPDWFNAPVDQMAELVTNLPIIVINTNNQSIVDEPKITARMGVIDNGSGNKNAASDSFNIYDGFIGIETRGNSTQSFPKKPYVFETRDADGNNLNVSLLGMPAENDWILRASYLDHTFIRNSLANYMSTQTGRWASRTRHVELILDGQYQGIYLLMEKIKRDDNRVDIANLKPEDTEGEELTGGYIWQVNGFGNEFGYNRNMVDPDLSELTSEQRSYIQGVDDAFRNLMSGISSIYSNPNTGCVQHIDVESFIAEIMVQEGIRNSDSYAWSAYFHKDKNGLINAGPVWDFDQSAGNSSYPDNGDHTMWMFDHRGKRDAPAFWKILFDDPFFKYSLKLRWEELRADKFSDENLFAFIDSIAADLDDAQAREFAKWDVLGKYVWRETTGYEQRDTYQKEVDYLKDFLTKRWSWMDEQLAGVTKPIGYPEITVGADRAFKVNIFDSVTFIGLNQIFSYPYSSPLEFQVLSVQAEEVLDAKVKSKTSLRIKPKIAGRTQILIQAKDIYGNKQSVAVEVAVTSGEDVSLDFETNLPIVIIETTDNAPIPQRERNVGHMGIISGSKNTLGGLFNEYDGLISIEVKGDDFGNTLKQSFSFETQDAQGENLNVSLLGMPEENDWILDASYMDHTFIRRSLATNIASQMGHWSSRGEHVELIVNGEYIGIYLLREKVKKDKNRVHIAKLDKDEVSGDDLTGGYLWKIDELEDEWGENRNMVEPDFKDLAPEQLAYITKVDDEFRSLMAGAEYVDPNYGYASQIDVKSFVDYLLIQEVMSNTTGYSYESHFIKDKNERISAGPVDYFDQSIGNSSLTNEDYLGWIVLHDSLKYVPAFWPRLFEDSFFRFTMKNRWEELREGHLSVDQIHKFIDSLAIQLSDAQIREFQKWDVLGTGAVKSGDSSVTYLTEISFLKDYITHRIEWLDAQISLFTKPSGYPSIKAYQIPDMELGLEVEVAYLDLDAAIGYPYDTPLKYKVWSENDKIVTLDVKKSDSLKMELLNPGSTIIHLRAQDTYGNTDSTSFSLTINGFSEGILSANHFSELSLYPNPFNHYLLVQSKKTLQKILIYQTDGQLLNTYTDIKSNDFKLDFSVLSNGGYILKVEYADGTSLSVRVVKE